MTIEQVSGLALPTTIAIGHAEAGPNPAAFGPGIVAAMPKAQLQEYPHLGHFGPLQDPDSVAEDILAFARTSASARPENFLGGRDGVCRVSTTQKFWADGGGVDGSAQAESGSSSAGRWVHHAPRYAAAERKRRPAAGSALVASRQASVYLARWASWWIAAWVARRATIAGMADSGACHTPLAASSGESVSESSGSLADGGSGTHPGSSVTRPSVERNPST